MFFLALYFPKLSTLILQGVLLLNAVLTGKILHLV